MVHGRVRAEGCRARMTRRAILRGRDVVGGLANHAARAGVATGAARGDAGVIEARSRESDEARVAGDAISRRREVIGGLGDRRDTKERLPVVTGGAARGDARVVHGRIGKRHRIPVAGVARRDPRRNVVSGRPRGYRSIVASSASSRSTLEAAIDVAAHAIDRHVGTHQGKAGLEVVEMRSALLGQRCAGWAQREHYAEHGEQPCTRRAETQRQDGSRSPSWRAAPGTASLPGAFLSSAPRIAALLRHEHIRWRSSAASQISDLRA